MNLEQNLNELLSDLNVFYRNYKITTGTLQDKTFSNHIQN